MKVVALNSYPIKNFIKKNMYEPINNMFTRSQLQTQLVDAQNNLLLLNQQLELEQAKNIQLFESFEKMKQLHNKEIVKKTLTDERNHRLRVEY